MDGCRREQCLRDLGAPPPPHSPLITTPPARSRPQRYFLIRLTYFVLAWVTGHTIAGRSGTGRQGISGLLLVHINVFPGRLIFKEHQCDWPIGGTAVTERNNLVIKGIMI